MPGSDGVWRGGRCPAGAARSATTMERHEKRKGNRQRASPDRKDGLALEAAPASGRRPQRSRDDRPGRHQADPDHDDSGQAGMVRAAPPPPSRCRAAALATASDPTTATAQRRREMCVAAKLDEASDRRCRSHQRRSAVEGELRRPGQRQDTRAQARSWAAEVQRKVSRSVTLRALAGRLGPVGMSDSSVPPAVSDRERSGSLRLG